MSCESELWCRSHPSIILQRFDRIPIQMTGHPKLALILGRFTAEDVVKSIRNSRCNPELSVRIGQRLAKRTAMYCCMLAENAFECDTAVHGLVV